MSGPASGMSVSVLLPSRGRTHLLAGSIGSLRDHATRPERVEVLVATDPDDPDTADTAHQLGAQVHTAPERWGYARLYEYYNLLAARAAGDWLLLWNDDATMTGQGWDDQLRALPDQVLVADLANHFSPHMCCFPAVRRAAVAALGAFSLPTPHVDCVWQDIGRHLGAIAPVTAYVRHDRHDLTGANDDPTWREGRDGLRHHDYYSPDFQAALAAAADQVRAVIA